ncbi:MAG: serine/threonine protein kinase [Polyangiaceae bacterium]|nr:serine/threonine protein kinase [Polyangiaceae bacterium]
MTLLRTGARLDRYELVCPIAQGGMAQVWVGRIQGRHGFEKLVAIKTILAQHAADPRFQRMFLDEARIIANIRHPNVAQILDLGQEDDLMYLVLEWIDGDSVSSLRRVAHGAGERLPLGVVMRIVSDTLAGLHAAHQVRSPDGKLRGVVHRDVSPANVLVSRSGEVKVIDFGVAKAIDRLSEETSAGVIKGKVAYMAPEQALGKDIDCRVDIWAAGVMLYQLLSGRAPYEGDNQLATLARLVKGMPPDPLRGVPPEVAEVVYTALAYEPDGRYSTADEMHRTLETTIVELCGPITQADVGQYVCEKLAGRLEKRQRQIERALEAGPGDGDAALTLEPASESVRVEGELFTPAFDHDMLERARASARSMPDLERRVDEVMEQQRGPLPPPSAPPPRPAAGMPPPEPVSVPTLPRLRPAARAEELESSGSDSIPPNVDFGKRRTGPLILAGFAVAVALLGYGAYLAYDRVMLERELSRPPSTSR